MTDYRRRCNWKRNGREYRAKGDGRFIITKENGRWNLFNTATGMTSYSSSFSKSRQIAQIMADNERNKEQ